MKVRLGLIFSRRSVAAPLYRAIIAMAPSVAKPISRVRNMSSEMHRKALEQDVTDGRSSAWLQLNKLKEEVADLTFIGNPNVDD